MRIIVFIITALIQAAAAVVIFLMLILGLNGFNEKDAMPSIIFFIVLSVACALVVSGVGAFAAGRFVARKALGGVAASAVSIIGFSVIGVLVLIGGFFVALVIASVMHDMK